VRYPNSDYVLFNEDGEPNSFLDILNHKDKEKWINVMHDKMNSLKQNHIYKLVELPNGKTVVAKLRQGCVKVEVGPQGLRLENTRIVRRLFIGRVETSKT
jgi:hypothetical protein